MKHAAILILIILVNTGFAFSDEMDKTDKKSAPLMMMSDSIPKITGGKVLYSTLDAAKKIAETSPAVLFFYASWCPTCRAAIKDIDARINELGDITVIIVDYDKEKGLKAQFKIPYQHTFVQINAKGEKTAIWSGGGIDAILKNVNRKGNG